MPLVKDKYLKSYHEVSNHEIQSFESHIAALIAFLFMIT